MEPGESSGQMECFGTRQQIWQLETDQIDPGGRAGLAQHQAAVTSGYFCNNCLVWLYVYIYVVILQRHGRCHDPAVRLDICIPLFCV